MRKRQILIIGNNDNGCTPELEKIAFNAGAEVAKSDSVLITGGLGGDMRASWCTRIWWNNCWNNTSR